MFHILRDFRTLLVLFGMPVIQIILFGYAIRTEINEADIAIFDRSKDYLTSKLNTKILSSGYYNINAYINNFSDIEEAFKAGKVNQVIVYEPDFAHKLMKDGTAQIQIISDGSNPNLAGLLNTYTTSIIADFQKELSSGPKMGNVTIRPEVKMLFNAELRSVNMFVPGLVAFVLMLVCALMTSIAITREKEMGTMEVLLVSPLKPGLIIIGKVVPYVLLSLVNLVSILAVALLIFDIPFRGSFLLFFGESSLFIFTALSLGIMISTISETQQTAMMLSLAGLLMPTMLLSGFIFPIENMPVILQWVSHIIPAKWFLIIVRGIMLKGIGIEYFWKETLILLGMTLFCLAVSVKNFKIRLE